MTTDPAAVYSSRLVGDLEAAGLAAHWLGAMRDVPRHLFLPDVVYRHERGRVGNDLIPLSRTERPAEWLRLAYADTSVNTQVNDGAPDTDGTGREVTSSASQPSVVGEMLALLDPQPGQRVLEIGTGTGWNAALLARRVGAEQVTTIDIDPRLVEHARAALRTVGYQAVTVVAGDGTLGWPAGAPYERVIATVGAHTIPYAWVEQTAPGGRLVVPLANTYQPPGLVTLTRNDDGTACGRLAGPAAFMELRGQRVPRVLGADMIGAADAKSTTSLHPYRFVGDRDAAVAIGQRVTGIHKVWEPRSPGAGHQWLYDPDTRSWASVFLIDEPPWQVAQAGPRRLFDEVAEAYQWWRQQGRPKVADWLVTVGPSGQSIALG